MPSDLSIHPETPADGVLRLRLGGTLDRSAAYRLRDELERLIAEEPRRLEIDFSCVEQVSDYSLGILAMGLAGRGERAPRLRGLGAHAQRILRAFGVDAAA